MRNRASDHSDAAGKNANSYPDQQALERLSLIFFVRLCERDGSGAHFRARPEPGRSSSVVTRIRLGRLAPISQDARKELRHKPCRGDQDDELQHGAPLEIMKGFWWAL
jgi:hypothetical protein